MKILYSHYLSQPNHPALCMVEQIAAQLREFGHEVRVHSSMGMNPVSEGPKPGPQTPANASRRSQKVRSALWFAKEMTRNRKWYPRDYKAIKAYQPDIILGRQDAYFWTVAHLSGLLNVPLVTYADAPVAYESRMFNSDARWHPGGLVEQIEKWGLRRSAAVISVSRPGQLRLQKYGLPCPVHAISNGVDPSRFEPPSEAERAVLKRELGLDRPIILGFQGSFRDFHGIDRLRDLMLAFADDPRVQWLLIGDGPERESIQREVANVSANFLGFRQPSEMGRLLSVMDIAVAPHAQMEGDFYFCPLKILEYAASGCAVVASDQGDIPLLLDEGRAGMIVTSDEQGEWEAAIRGLLDDSEHRKELGQRARSHVLSNLTWAATARKVEAVLQTATASR
jgi:glycosyltransferase involved in cell wall biosynthesis